MRYLSQIMYFKPHNRKERKENIPNFISKGNDFVLLEGMCIKRTTVTGERVQLRPPPSMLAGVPLLPALPAAFISRLRLYIKILRNRPRELGCGQESGRLISPPPLPSLPQSKFREIFGFLIACSFFIQQRFVLLFCFGFFMLNCNIWIK